MKNRKASAICVGPPRKEPRIGFLSSNPERAAIARERKRAMVAESNAATPDEPRKSQAMQDFENLIETGGYADMKPISPARAAVQSP